MLFLALIPAFFVVLGFLAEFRSPRPVRLWLGIAAISSTVSVAGALHFMRQMELADRFHRATDHLSYAIEAAIQSGRGDRAKTVLGGMRGAGHDDLGTPPEYWRTIDLAADQINRPDESRR
jgi:hypothetical protein